jgi:hypothetical protein
MTPLEIDDGRMIREVHLTGKIDFECGMEAL